MRGILYLWSYINTLKLAWGAFYLHSCGLPTCLKARRCSVPDFLGSILALGYIYEDMNSKVFGK